MQYRSWQWRVADRQRFIETLTETGNPQLRRSATAIVDQRGIAEAMSPVEVKALAVQLLIQGQAARSRQMLRLRWRHVGLVPGTLIRSGGWADVWQVREARFENFIVHLELERVHSSPATATTPMLTARAAGGGRALVFDDQPAGPTTLLVLDLPGLAGEGATGPRLWVAGRGAGAGWRRAGVTVSLDDGASYVTLGVLGGDTVVGTVVTVLGDGQCAGWDRFASVDVELLSDQDWLEGRSAEVVLAGGNLALVGDELIQFMAADALGPRRFRLHGLLRGRRGTEAATRGHRAGERFVLIEPGRMLAFDPPLEMLGRNGRAKPVGNGDADTAPVAFAVGAAALRPLSPVHLRASWAAGDVMVDWTRRSRAGFGWTDFVDAPLGESNELYAVGVRLDGRQVRADTTIMPQFVYSAAQFAEDGGGGTIAIRISQ